MYLENMNINNKIQNGVWNLVYLINNKLWNFIDNSITKSVIDSTTTLVYNEVKFTINHDFSDYEF